MTTLLQAKSMRIPASEFKARCLELMDRVKLRREEIVITKHGKPVAKLVPIEDKAAPLFGALAGTVMIAEDIIAPVDETWNADD